MITELKHNCVYFKHSSRIYYPTAGNITIKDRLPPDIDMFPNEEEFGLDKARLKKPSFTIFAPPKQGS